MGPSIAPVILCNPGLPLDSTWVGRELPLNAFDSYSILVSAAARRHVPGTLNSSPTQGFHKEAHQLMEVGFYRT
jgi:hypothetical protein